MPTYHSNASRKPRVAPGDLPGSIGVCDRPDWYIPVGVAYEAGVAGGWLDGDGEPGDDDWLGPPEAVWRLDVGGVTPDRRFALRGGVFVELGDTVI